MRGGKAELVFICLCFHPWQLINVQLHWLHACLCPSLSGVAALCADICLIFSFWSWDNRFHFDWQLVILLNWFNCSLFEIGGLCQHSLLWYSALQTVQSDRDTNKELINWFQLIWSDFDTSVIILVPTFGAWMWFGRCIHLFGTAFCVHICTSILQWHDSWTWYQAKIKEAAWRCFIAVGSGVGIGPLHWHCTSDRIRKLSLKHRHQGTNLQLKAGRRCTISAGRARFNLCLGRGIAEKSCSSVLQIFKYLMW